MRLSDLYGKEVINLSDGAKLGIIDDCELTFELETGKIQALIVPNRNGFFNILGDHRVWAIPWEAIKRIGDEVIIVDLSIYQHTKSMHY